MVLWSNFKWVCGLLHRTPLLIVNVPLSEMLAAEPTQNYLTKKIECWTRQVFQQKFWFNEYSLMIFKISVQMMLQLLTEETLEAWCPTWTKGKYLTAIRISMPDENHLCYNHWFRHFIHLEWFAFCLKCLVCGLNSLIICPPAINLLPTEIWSQFTSTG